MARETHMLASKIHTQERVVHSLAHRCRNRAQNGAPGSWSTEDARGGAHFSQRLMGRRRLGFEKVDLQDLVDLASETLKETIHDEGEVAGKGWKKQQLFSKGRVRSRTNSREICVLSLRENPRKKESLKLKKKEGGGGGVALGYKFHQIGA
jgi:hypothetical protein